MLTKRQFLLSIAALSVSSALQAAGGPSGPAVHFQAQGKIGEVFVNPYRIAPLTAIIGNGGYELKDVSVRVVPKKGGQEIAYAVSDAQVLTHGGIPVFGLYPDYRNTVEITYDRIYNGKTEHFTDKVFIRTQPVYGLVPFPKAEVKKAAEGKFADRLYYINNIGGNNNTRHAVWNNPEGGALQWSSYPLNMVIDTRGEVRWFLYPEGIYDVDSLYDGGIMMGLRQNDDGAITWGYGQRYVKYDLMGREIWNRRLPISYNDFSHSLDPAQNGHFFLRVASSNVKLANGQNVRTVRDVIAEVDHDGYVVDEFRLFDILDPYRSDVIKALDQGAVCLNIDPSKAGHTLTAEDLAKLYPDYKEDETKKAPRGDAFICCYYDASYNLARKKVCNSEKEMLNLYYSLFNTCEAKYFYYTKEADAWMAEKQNLIARKTGTPIPAAQPTQATPAVPPPFVPTAPAKSHEYYCCFARWDGSYIGYETYKSEQAAQNARKQIARRGETAVYATVEEAEAWVEQQKAARTRR